MARNKYTSIVLVCLFLFSCSAKDTSVAKIDLIYPTETTTQTPIQTPSPTPVRRLDKYLIQTAFVPQAPEKNWDQPWQDACEEAALLTLYYYYQQINPNLNQIKNDLLSVIDYQNTIGLGHDININQIGQIATDFYGYDFLILDNPTITEIKDYLSSNTPVLVTANGKKLYKENRHFRNGGPDYHALAILGFDQSKQIFIVHDVGTQHGTYFKYTYTTLMDAIADLPQTGKIDINRGAKKALVLFRK